MNKLERIKILLSYHFNILIPTNNKNDSIIDASSGKEIKTISKEYYYKNVKEKDVEDIVVECIYKNNPKKRTIKLFNYIYDKENKRLTIIFAIL
jgi:hypothetical protein